jgi:hypothetical protein
LDRSEILEALIPGRTQGHSDTAADQPFYSGKHKKHGMNLQVIASPDGDIPWVSGALPGSVGERANAQLKAWRILRKLRCRPWRAGKLAKAIHVLQLREA